MTGRERRAEKRKFRQLQKRRRFLTFFMILVILIGFFVLKKLIDKPAVIETETIRIEEETEENLNESTENVEEEIEDVEEGTEETENPIEEIQGYSDTVLFFGEILESTILENEPNGENIIEVFPGEYVEVFGSVDGYTKISYDGNIGYIQDESIGNASIDNQFKVVEGILIVNRNYYMPENYDPGLSTELINGFSEMKEAASAEGLVLDIGSGYRDYQYQLGVIERNTALYGEEDTRMGVAQAGYSEHQTGLAIDIINDNPEHSIQESFKNTDEGIWLENNAHRFGFILRYPEGKEDITGYMYEPWHFRYIGEDMATKVYNSGLTLEEYLNLD